MPIIVFDPEETGDNDGFIRTVRSLEGFLLRFTMFDGTTVKGVVKGDLNSFYNELTIELWEGDQPVSLDKPAYRTIDLNDVVEVYYY